jgi:acyl-coenzyme A thioesterase PaaI-like protein
MIDDIRTVTPEEHWAQFEKAWTTLLTYRYLGKRTAGLDAGVEIDSMPLRADMRNSTGGIMAAPLCIAAPEPDWPDDECVPAPVTMSYDILDPARDVSRVEVIKEVIQIGRAMGFSRSRIVDADDHDRVIAISTGSGVTLGDVPPGFVKVENPVYELEGRDDLPPLREVFGIHATKEGALEIDERLPELCSPHGALHLGPINIALEAAALDEIERATGSDRFQAVHWIVMMVKPGMMGPFRATATVLNAQGPLVGVEATLVDLGNNGRTVATASAAYQRVEG